MALVSAGSVNRIACGLTGDRNRLYAALDAIRPTDGAADLPAAVALGEDLIREPRHGRIIVATDRAAAAPGESGGASVIDWVVCGDSTENVGITRCEVRPRPSNPGDMELLVEVFNAGTRAARCPLEVDFRGAPVDRSTLEIGPRESVRRIRLIDNPAGGLLAARLIHADALAADNVAAVQVSGCRRTRIALITPGNRAVEAALTSLPGVDITVAGAADAAGPPADVVIWDGNVPALLPPGPSIVLAPATNCDLWTLGSAAVGSAVVLDQIELPPVAHVDFTQAVLEDPIRLEFKLPARTLVSSSAGDPIYSLLDRASGDVLVLHVRIDKTDLAARGMLPVLFADALRSFGLNAGIFDPAVTTAEMVSIPPAKAPRRLLPPGGLHGGNREKTAAGRQTIEPRQGVVGPLDRVGVWQLVASPARPDDRSTPPIAKSEPAPVIASQLTDRSQTDLNVARAGASTATTAAFESGEVGPWTWPLRFDGRLWPCFVLGALALVAVEALLGRWPSGN
jgi:hypothetical protein